MQNSNTNVSRLIKRLLGRDYYNVMPDGERVKVDTDQYIIKLAASLDKDTSTLLGSMVLMMDIVGKERFVNLMHGLIDDQDLGHSELPQ